MFEKKIMKIIFFVFKFCFFETTITKFLYNSDNRKLCIPFNLVFLFNKQKEQIIIFLHFQRF